MQLEQTIVYSDAVWALALDEAGDIGENFGEGHLGLLCWWSCDGEKVQAGSKGRRQIPSRLKYAAAERDRRR